MKKERGGEKKRKEETRKTKIKLFLLYIMPVVLVFFTVLYSRAIFSHVFAVLAGREEEQPYVIQFFKTY